MHRFGHDGRISLDELDVNRFDAIPTPTPIAPYVSMAGTAATSLRPKDDCPFPIQVPLDMMTRKNDRVHDRCSKDLVLHGPFECGHSMTYFKVTYLMVLWVTSTGASIGFADIVANTTVTFKNSDILFSVPSMARAVESALCTSVDSPTQMRFPLIRHEFKNRSVECVLQWSKYKW